MTARSAAKSKAPGLRKPFPIAGIGASAGGLEAFTQLLQHFPADAGIALVLVQHLDPAHESELARLLARATRMPVHEVTNNLRVEADQVYVIPPGASLAIVKGVLKLEPRLQTRRPQHAIDGFFESLAQDQRERAIGVVLSGTGTDGTVGLEAIKAEGGITFAQDETAKYDSMPRSAVAAGCVDFTLSPENIARELVRIARHPYVLGSAGESPKPSAAAGATRDAGERAREAAIAHEDDAAALPSGGRGAPSADTTRARAEAERSPPGPEEDGFKRILLLLRNHSGVDFSLYKSTTIQRRIARRMVLGKHNTFADYAKFLRGNGRELDTLFSDVLISVTSFFRNPEAFEVLKRIVFPKLLKERRDDSVRIWVLGCSTGQEAYSVAMAFTEAADRFPRAPKLQIFATDLNETLLDKARAGLYAKSLEADISPGRLRRFFVEEEGGYRVIKPLREAVVFARQNLLSDPPFSRMDLICCRNLLIYLEPALQRKLLPTFHYALKPEGFLFLGAAESIGAFHDLFEPVDRKQKIFSKKPASMTAQHPPALGKRPPEKRRSPVAVRPELAQPLRSELSAQREADRIIVNEFAPPGVLVDAALQIVQFRGATADYLVPPRGKASFDVLKMAREGLMLPLRAAINKAKKEHQPARKAKVPLRLNGRTRTVDIEVIPLKNMKECNYLILFEEASGTTNVPREARGRQRRGRGTEPSSDASKSTTDADERADVRTLRARLTQAERELAETRDYLQAVQEQHDAANEELQATSEEAQSANEELQSINEELETSKEELESTNEELTTVNEEMANRNAELNRLNADLGNLHVSIRTAILVLRRDLTIRSFTPFAEKAFNLVAADVGRRLGGVRHTLFIADEAGGTKGEALGSPLDLEVLVREVIDTVSGREREVRDQDGHWYSLRVRPYMTVDNKIDGAVLVLIDIDALKRSEREAAAALSFAEATIRAVRDPLVALDGALRVRTASDAFYRTFQVARQETEGRLIYELGEGQWNIPALRSLLEEILPRDKVFNDFEVTHDFPNIGRRMMLLNGRRLETAGEPDLILLGIEDITERKQTDEALRRAGERFRLLAETVPEKIFTARPNGERDYFNQQWLDYAGLSLAQLSDWGWAQLVHPDDVAEVLRVWRRCTASGEPYRFEHRLRNFDGEYRWHLSRAVPLKDAEGNVLMWVGSNTDIHDVKESDRRKDEFLAMLAHELRNPLAPLRNAVQIVRQEGGSDVVMKAVDMMDRQVGQMVRLVDELLDVSRISRGRIDLHRSPVELASVVSQAAEAARPTVDWMEQELLVAFPAQPLYVDADPTRLAQIVGNLLNNASKFTARGGRIGLTVEQDDAQAVISVRDTGIGIAAEDLPRVFDMFMQVDTSLARQAGGLGIGLTLVKRLVEMHGGTVEARSEGLGRGAEFVVRLPLSAKPQEAAVAQPSADSLAPRCILVVDDNQDAAESLAMLLRVSGHDVHVAHDGLEAVAAAARLQPDVILLDVGLPKLDGYEAARQIRQQRRDKELLLVALTGWGQEQDRRRSKEAGFDVHLVKPVTLTTLEKVLGSRPQPR